MSLTTQDMQRLESQSRAIDTQASLPYIADALRCLLDTRDPIAALVLLHALWGSGHAKRANQKAGLERAGQWLEERIRREIDISPERLALEIGWLYRLLSVHGERDDDRGDGDRLPPRQADAARTPFGAHIELFRGKREAALARAVAFRPVAPRGGPRDQVASPPPPRPERLPDTFEARFTSWQDAHVTFKHARNRRKQHKALKDRLIDVTPVAAELQPLATDLACSMLHTAGMIQLLDHLGDLPTFWIAAADLTPRDGRRVPSRISLVPATQRAP